MKVITMKTENANHAERCAKPVPYKTQIHVLAVDMDIFCTKIAAKPVLQNAINVRAKTIVIPAKWDTNFKLMVLATSVKLIIVLNVKILPNAHNVCWAIALLMELTAVNVC